MAKVSGDQLAKAIDTCIDVSERLERVEIVIKGLKNDIDEISTTLFFHYKKDSE